MFLKAHRRTLKVLNLHDVLLLSGTWAEVAEDVCKHLDLHAASLGGLKVAYPYVQYGSGDRCGFEERNIRKCFRNHPDLALSGDMDDYMCHRIYFNPIRQAETSRFNCDPTDSWSDG